ncbi:MAG: RluA family pseudouridine synthase [Planctomycetes bacterium]|nr:RluA family pseudouridine synthase [Planctomycetota bacterium]
MAQSLYEILAAMMPGAKRRTLKRMVETGRVLVNGSPARNLKQEVSGAGEVRIEPRPGRAVEGVAPLDIVHEDRDLIVVHKPAGLLASTTPEERRPTAFAILKRYLRHSDRAARLGIIHRLDLDASGLLVFSKNSAAYHSLKQQFFDHTVDRVYHACVEGVPGERAGRISSRLVELPDGSVRSTRTRDGGKRAELEYETIASDADSALLRVKLSTGRKHQIRVQLAELGHAVIGDALYPLDRKAGGEEPRRAPRLLLAATALGFTHPRSGERMAFEAELPPEMRALFPRPAERGAIAATPASPRAAPPPRPPRDRSRARSAQAKPSRAAAPPRATSSRPADRSREKPARRARSRPRKSDAAP